MNIPVSYTHLDVYKRQVNKCKEEGNTTDLIVVRDTSGSMGAEATGTSMSCYNVGTGSRGKNTVQESALRGG